MSNKTMKVNNNYEKQRVYAIHMQKYKKAMKEKFYVEAICIVYAMCEDRLNSFLYYSGCVNRDLKITKKYSKDIRKIWKLEDKDKYNLNKISSKYNYILRMLEWSELSNQAINEFEIKLKEKIIGETDISEIVEVINKLKIWCEDRNSIIHALLNKNPESLNEKLQLLAEIGYDIARDFDNIVKKYKAKNDIRIKLKIQ